MHFTKNRRDVLALLAGSAATLASTRAGAQALGRREARCYVDALNGADDRDGSSPGTALKSLAAIRKLRDRPTWIGLARGSRFAGSLVIGRDETVEAYGEGPSPIVDASEVLAADAWTKVNEFSWAYGRKLTWVEQVLFDDTLGVKKEALTAADPNRTWSWVGSTIHVRSDKSPGESSREVRVLSQTCFHLLRADRARIRGIVAERGVHGFLGQYSRGVSITGCAAHRCAANGFFLANQTAEWTLEDCVADRNAACGFAFNYGAERSAIRRSRGTRNGIDGCQFSEGCGSENSLTDCVFSENAIGGINCKEKHQTALRCRLEANGETGAVAQNNTDLFEITDSLFIRNNRSDNGTMNLALEDHARVNSTRNIFIDPYGKAKPSANVRLIGRSSLYSVTDCFIDAERGNNDIATIRVYTSEAATLSLIHASIYNRTAAVGGRVLDCREAANLSLKIANTAVSSDGPCLTYDERARVDNENNCIDNVTGGALIEVTGARTRLLDSRGWRTAGTQSSSIAADPGFADPAAPDLALKPGSPARRAGKDGYASVDVLGHRFGSPPNIGAVAERGDLRVRLRP